MEYTKKEVLISLGGDERVIILPNVYFCYNVFFFKMLTYDNRLLLVFSGVARLKLSGAERGT